MSDTTTKPGRRSGADATVALLLASGHSVQAAAAQSGVSESTIFRRLKSPEFRSRIDEIRARVLEQSVGLLSNAATQAATELQAIIADKDTPKSVKVNACRLILEFSLKSAEQLSIARQLTALRDEVARLQNGRVCDPLGTQQAPAAATGTGDANKPNTGDDPEEFRFYPVVGGVSA